MSRSRVIFLLTVALVLSAGLVVGRLSAKLPAVNMPHGQQGPSWVADQLHLSSDQRQQMDAVWAEARQKIGKTFDQRHVLDKQRDAAIAALLTPEQKIAFDKINSDYRSQRTELDQQREKLIHDAEERSRALLSDPQKRQWDELTKQMHARHMRHGGGDAPASATNPTSGPSGAGSLSSSH